VQVGAREMKPRLRLPLLQSACHASVVRSRAHIGRGQLGSGWGQESPTQPTRPDARLSASASALRNSAVRDAPSQEGS
jgi:hypothetical protein